MQIKMIKTSLSNLLLQGTVVYTFYDSPKLSHGAWQHDSTDIANFFFPKIRAHGIYTQTQY